MSVTYNASEESKKVSHIQYMYVYTVHIMYVYTSCNTHKIYNTHKMDTHNR